MDCILVVCYSYTGTSRQLAQLLCAQLGWPMGEIVETRLRAGPTGTLRCVVDSLLRRRPPIRYEGPDPREFQAVGHAPLAATAFTARAVDDGSCAPRVQAFGRALQQASPGAGTIAASTWSPRPA